MNALFVARYSFAVCAAVMLTFAGCAESVPPVLAYKAARARATATYEVMYSFGSRSNFGSKSNDGMYPEGALINSSGTLYGTTAKGGANHYGTVFAFSRSGGENVVYSFGSGSEDGQNPYAGLVAYRGAFYGTTEYGGANSCTGFGCGTAFSVTASGSENVIHSFGDDVAPAAPDGTAPVAGLTFVGSRLYGTTPDGGTNNEGTVFALEPSGSEILLHSFGKGDGTYPLSGLVSYKGILYGTTSTGGADGWGTVFSITTSGKETILHSFGASGDGQDPQASLMVLKGVLYGTTYQGGASGYGTVFAMTTSGKERILYSFAGGPGDGERPIGGVISFKGAFYGTTASGGNHFCGTVFSVAASGKETLIHEFCNGGGGPDGQDPTTGMIDVDGILYGTTAAGGGYNEGTIYAVKP